MAHPRPQPWRPTRREAAKRPCSEAQGTLDHPAQRTRRPDRAAREAMKKDRERDATAAMKEYEAEKRAVLANTERLRALRLAKEAGQAPAKPAKPAKATKKGS